MPNIDKIRVDGTDYDLVAPEIYDDQERVIGTWFGEPLYRKVLSLTATEYNNLETSNTYKLLPLDVRIKSIMRADIMVSNFTSDGTGTNNKTYAMHHVNTSTSSELGVNNCKTSVSGTNNSNLEIYVNNTAISRINGNIYITLEYTKATVNNQEQSEE